MKRRDLPLNCLRAFEAAGRHQSLTKAAAELGVTHSAIRHHIRRLEQQLQTRLLTRQGQGVRLTRSGTDLLPDLSEAFDRIGAGMTRLSPRSSASSLRITTTPTFASRWLLPRIAEWRRLYPGISTDIEPTLEFVDLANGLADIAIRCGQPPWAGLTAEFLRPIRMAPVASPTLLAKLAPLSPDRLVDLELIHADVGEHPLGEEWRMWLQAMGVDVRGPLGGTSFRDPAMAVQAAIDGLGLAIGYLDLVAPEIEAGRLVRPFPNWVEHYFSYYLVYSPSRTGQDPLLAFREWIMASFNHLS